MQIIYGTALTPYGDAFVAYGNGCLCALEFTECEGEGFHSALNRLKQHWPEAEILFDENIALRQYEGRLLVKGTPFQVKVWRALLNIPSGETATYSQIAAAIGAEHSVRAVATAIGKNPISYFIPCHRVIRKNGDIGGYRWGVEVKRKILNDEIK